uniref:XRE family transcriptional regulator n=1 Tax=Rheinheimera sp. TaxID=1869214 RepID=UPI004048C8D3
MLMKTVGQKIREARDNAGLKQPELAAKLGWGQSRISNYERNVREPGLDDLSAIAKVLRIDVADLLPTTQYQAKPPQIYSLGEEPVSFSVDANALRAGGFELWDSKTPLHADEVALPFYMEVELSAGAGSEVQREDNGFKLRFAKSTLRKSGVQPEHAACVKITGDSMEPVLPDSSTVGIDTNDKNIKDGKMYAIDHDGMLRVKMLYRLPGGGLRVKSYNSHEYPDETYTPEQAIAIKVIGKVFWSSVLW